MPQNLMKAKSNTKKRRSSAPPPKSSRLKQQPSSQRLNSSTKSSGQTDRTPATEADVSPKLPLEQQTYYHGVLPRQEIQRLLTSHGDFIARITKANNVVTVVISVFWNNDHFHFKLIQDEEYKWKVEKKRFNSIPELIHFHFTTRTPLTRRTGALLITPKKHEKWELDNDQIQLKDKLGSGAFGEVYMGILTIDNDKIEVAVKLCHESMPPDQKKKFVEEAHFMRQFEHPNIVKLYGVAATREPIMIVMEFVNGGGLDRYLRTNQGKGRLTTRLKTKFILMAGRGMEYLEINQCIHRDLAARNCLLDQKKNLKISDFGLSRSGDEYKVRNEDVKIPVRWTAPEALLTKTFTLKSDVWSFGILMWEIFSEGVVPYPALRDNIDVLRMLRADKRLGPPGNMPPEINAVMQQCWRKEPSERPGFTAINDAIETVYFAPDAQTLSRRAKSQPAVGAKKSMDNMTLKRRSSRHRRN